MSAVVAAFFAVQRSSRVARWGPFHKVQAQKEGHARVRRLVVVVVLVLVLVLVLVVVVVEWLYYSKRIIIVRWADLSDFFVDFRRKNV